MQKLQCAVLVGFHWGMVNGINACVCVHILWDGGMHQQGLDVQADTKREILLQNQTVKCVRTENYMLC
jgi:hypothetical protein